MPFADDATEHLSAARKDAIVLGDQMMLAWLDLLEAETRAHPLLIVLEDLPRGDYPSGRFVDSALREHRERPLMVFALARPEVEELFPSCGASAAHTSSDSKASASARASSSYARCSARAWTRLR